MPNSNEFYRPGDFILDYVLISSFDGKHGANIGLGEILELNITENIMTSNITGDIKVRDKRAYIERLPIIGDEYISIKFRVPQRSDKDAILLDNMRIYKITEREVTGVDQGVSETYRLHFISQETLITFNESISRSFSDQTVDNIVKTIWKDYVTPVKGEKKVIDVESTTGKVNFIAPNWTPFKAINWLTENMAVDKSGNADFLFYEATNKSKGSSYHFKSIDSLFKQKPSYTLFFGPQNLSKNGEKDRSTSQRNIPEYGYDKSGNVIDNTIKGQYYQYWIFHDILRKKFVVSKLSHEEDFLKPKGSEKIDKKFYADTVKKEAKPLQYIRMPGNINTFPTKVAKSKGINNDISTAAEPNPRRKSVEYISKREETKNLETSDLNAQVAFAREFKLQQINNYKLIIDYIPGTDEIQLGKMIEFMRPHPTDDQSAFLNASGKVEEKYLSGNYLVTRVDHCIYFDGDMNAWRYKIGIDAVKDQFEEKVSYLNVKSGD